MSTELVHLGASAGRLASFLYRAAGSTKILFKSHLNLYLELLVLRPSRDKQRAAGLRALGEEVRVNGLCADGVHEELGEEQPAQACCVPEPTVVASIAGLGF